MSEIPGPPELHGLDLLTQPLPWEPSKRHDIVMHFPNGAFWELAKGTDTDTRRSIREYLNWYDRRYLMPGHVADVVRDGLRADSSFADLLFTPQTNDDYYLMIERFEQNYLGLPPTESGTGLRWWQTSAGFSSGQYSTETIASLVNMTPVPFLEYVKANKTPVGHVIIKSDDFLIPVADSHLSEDVVLIDGVKELTASGNEFLEEILSVYEKGLKASH